MKHTLRLLLSLLLLATLFAVSCTTLPPASNQTSETTGTTGTTEPTVTTKPTKPSTPTKPSGTTKPTETSKPDDDASSSDPDELDTTPSTGPNGLVYQRVEGGYEVTAYKGTGANVIVPPTYNGLPVVKINGAFTSHHNGGKDLPHVKSIVIPDSVQTIIAGSFNACLKLESLTVPFITTSSNGWDFHTIAALLYAPYAINGGHTSQDFSKLTDITITKQERLEAGAFAEFVPLARITLPDCMTEIGDDAFRACPNLESIVIPDGVQVISPRAFADCPKLKTVTLNQGLKAISESAFRSCTALGRISLPDGVETIGDSAFQACEGLASVTLPASLQSIGVNAFTYHPSLNEIIMRGENDHFAVQNGLLTEKATKKLVLAALCGNETVSALAGIEIIGSGAFSSNPNLTEAHIPEWITTVEEYAFAGCQNLHTLSVTPATASVSIYAFTDCAGVRTVTAPTTCPIPTSTETLTLIGGGEIKTQQYIRYENLKTLTVGSGITKIGNAAFFWCENLREITLSDDITKLEGSIFTLTAYYKNEANWQNGILRIGNYIIDVKPDLTGVYNVPVGIRAIAESAFEGCNQLTAITIPEGIRSLPYGTFSECSALVSVELPDSLEAIGGSVFAECYALREINFPTALRSIGTWAFYNCKSLTALNLPNGIEALGDFTFNGCTSLRSITLPNALKSIGRGALANCTSLTRLVIPASVTSIGDTPFDGSYRLFEICNLSAVTIEANESSYPRFVTANPNETRIHTTADGFVLYRDGVNAPILFAYVGENTELTLPNNLNGEVYTVFDKAFKGNTAITKITLPDGMTTLPNEFFYGCTSLRLITLPASLETIGNHAFRNCTALESITFPASLQSIGMCAFMDCTALEAVVFEGESQLTSLGNSAFRGCSALESFTIPKGIMTLGDYVFYNCTALKTVTAEDGSELMKFGGGCFFGCTSLTDVYLPFSKEKVGLLTYGNGWASYTGDFTVHCTDGDMKRSDLT